MGSPELTADDDLVGPPTSPDLGPPIPGKQMGNVTTIGTDEPSKITTKPIDPTTEAEARALHRAIHHRHHRTGW